MFSSQLSKNANKFKKYLELMPIWSGSRCMFGLIVVVFFYAFNLVFYFNLSLCVHSFFTFMRVILERCFLLPLFSLFSFRNPIFSLSFQVVLPLMTVDGCDLSAFTFSCIFVICFALLECWINSIPVKYIMWCGVILVTLLCILYSIFPLWDSSIG